MKIIWTKSVYMMSYGAEAVFSARDPLGGHSCQLSESRCVSGWLHFVRSLLRGIG